MNVLVSLLCSLTNLPMICTLNLHDNCESFLPIELNVATDAPLTDLEEMFDPPLTSLPNVTPSFLNTPMHTSVSDLPLVLACLPLQLNARAWRWVRFMGVMPVF